MISRFAYVVCVILLTNMTGRAIAFGMPSSKPIPQIITQSQTIAIVSLTDYQPAVPPADPANNTPPSTGGTGPDIFISRPMKPAGHYIFHVISCLKGNAASPLRVNLPYVLSLYYGGFDLPIQNGSRFLLFLNNGADGKPVPTDATIPFVPLTESPMIPENPANTVEENVYRFMLTSCGDAKIRRANTFILRAVVNPMIVVGLFRYIDDADFYTKNNVLTCMATNQQVTAIPRIAALEEQGSGADAVIALNSFQSPEALPYLNRLLFSPAYYVRLNSVFAIDRLANRSSFPYLILALRDPDVQNIIPQSAYGLLHQLNPSLGKAFGDNYFAQHRAVETAKLLTWWSDELLGKHLKPGEHPAIPAVFPKTPTLLNPLLFIPDTATRRTAADKLARLGDKSSIPYLILALQDPDPQQNDGNVPYVAYKTLHRLIPALGPAEASSQFAASPEIAKEPIYQWWQAELMGKHLPR